MDTRIPEIRNYLKKKLDSARYEHTLGVSYTCQALAMRYGYDLDKAELAGILHDCAKCYDNETLLKKCRKRGLSVTPGEERDPSLLHAKLGAWMAKEKFGVDDREILDAICCHTTGRPQMTFLDKLLYVSDYIEPRRDKAANLTEMRRLAFLDLNQACLEIMESILNYLNAQGCVVDDTSIEAYEDMKKTLSEPSQRIEPQG